MLGAAGLLLDGVGVSPNSTHPVVRMGRGKPKPENDERAE